MHVNFNILTTDTSIIQCCFSNHRSTIDREREVHFLPCHARIGDYPSPLSDSAPACNSVLTHSCGHCHLVSAYYCRLANLAEFLLVCVRHLNIRGFHLSFWLYKIVKAVHGLTSSDCFFFLFSLQRRISDGKHNWWQVIVIKFVVSKFSLSRCNKVADDIVVYVFKEKCT